MVWLEHIRLQITSCPGLLKFAEDVLNLKEDGKLETILLLWLWWHQRSKPNSEDAAKNYGWHISFDKLPSWQALL
jgi:hypothetical protein